MPPIKIKFQIPLGHLAPNHKKMSPIKKNIFKFHEHICPQFKKNAPHFLFIILKKFAPIYKICHHFFQICQSQMGLKKELYGPLEYSCTESAQILHCHLLYLIIYLAAIKYKGLKRLQV